MSSNKPSSGGVAKALQPYVCGGAAAMFASCVIHPIDLTKTRLQLIGQGQKGAKLPSPLEVMRGIVAEGGVSKLYAGLSAALMRQAVYGTARLGLHREFSDELRRRNGDGTLSALQSVGSSMLSGAIASVLGNPFDISLVRMQADGLKPAAERRGYKNVFDALSRISREEGIAGLWRGFEPTVFRAIAMNVGMMASYDQAKQAIAKVNGDNLGTQMAASLISGFACAFTSLPFDMMKTRLQNMKADPTTGAMPYKGVLDCGAKIFAQEGLLAFWSGFGAYFLRCAPHSITVLLSLEQFNRLYVKAFLTKKE